MSVQSHKTKIEALFKAIARVSPSLSFTIAEVGALPIEGQEEPFYALLDYFPASRIIAFEVDEKLCSELNDKSRSNVTYFPVALGDKEEERPFYETTHPMCCSLYRPNEDLMRNYNNLEVAMLKSTGTITTTSLDSFARQNSVDEIDLIKIDVQGAELDVFKGATKALDKVVFIVSEVEFIPLYIDQPLFGDVCEYLTEKGLMFHKFLGMAGRSIKPIVIDSDPNFASQHMWADAIFIREISRLSNLAAAKLLKMGILAYMYGSPDVAFLCFKKYDEEKGTNISQGMLNS